MLKIQRLKFKTRSFSKLLHYLKCLYKLIMINSLNLKGGLQNKIGPQLSFLIIVLKLVISNGNVFVCCYDDDVVGGLISFRSCIFKSKNFIDSIAVNNINHRNGLGSNLIYEFENYLLSRKQDKIFIYLKTLKKHNSKVISFYMKNGFKFKSSSANNRFLIMYKKLRD